MMAGVARVAACRSIDRCMAAAAAMASTVDGNVTIGRRPILDLVAAAPLPSPGERPPK